MTSSEVSASVLRTAGSTAEPDAGLDAGTSERARTRRRSRPSRLPRGDRHTIRPEIQALRAVAVGLVVVYHTVPRLIPGGYIGVDVFFVISGFLITSQLARQVDATGSLRLATFYVRRARRLLPAALLVLATVGVSTLLFLPRTLWNDVGRQTVASALYVQNWTLASSSVDYLAAGTRPSPLQHFWSLSVEEQFYLVWPALLLVSVAVAGRRFGRRRAMAFAIAALVAVSLGYSVYETRVSPAWSYFVSTTRAWELGVGGLMAVCLPRLPGPRALRVVTSWFGLGLIAVSAMSMNGATPFPGLIAGVPVIGAVLVIVAGTESGIASTGRLIRLPFVQLIGDLSYSIYLWHWPLLVMVPLILGGPGYHPPTVVLPVLAAASLPLAWLSKRYVEDPLRTSPQPGAVVSRAVRVSFPVAVAAGMVLAVGSGAALFGISHARMVQAQRDLAAFEAKHLPCAGAGAWAADCQGHVPAGVHPDPLIATRDAVQQDCQQRGDRSALLPCHYGSDGASAPRVVVLGDSHANEWMPALTQVASSLGWDMVTYFKSGCPFAVGLGGHSCQDFDAAVATRLAADAPDLVITSARSGFGYGNHASLTQAAQGFERAWQPLLAAGARVVALADTPQPGLAGVLDPPSCVASQGSCDLKAHDAFGDDALGEAATRTGASVLDLDDLFCRDGSCPAVLGGVLVYRDATHMTAAFARTLAPALQQAVKGLGASHTGPARGPSSIFGN